MAHRLHHHPLEADDALRAPVVMLDPIADAPQNGDEIARRLRRHGRRQQGEHGKDGGQEDWVSQCTNQ